MSDHHHDFCRHCGRGFNDSDLSTLKSMVSSHESGCKDNPANSQQ